MKHVNEEWNGRRCDTCWCWNNGTGFGTCYRYPTSIQTDADHFCFEYKACQAKQFERKDKLIAEGKIEK